MKCEQIFLLSAQSVKRRIKGPTTGCFKGKNDVRFSLNEQEVSLFFNKQKAQCMRKRTSRNLQFVCNEEDQYCRLKLIRPCLYVALETNLIHTNLITAIFLHSKATCKTN